MNFYDFNGMGGGNGYGTGNGNCNDSGFDNGMNGGNCDNGGDFKDKFNSYASKSESELMDELAKVAQRMRAEGTFDVNMLENLYNTASPMLNQMQRERMRSIIDALKG